MMGAAGGDGAPFDILFVCFGNICRSPMAEGIARDIVARRYPGAQSLVRVSSAGVGAQDGNPPTPEAVEAMAERGIDISSHRARKVTAEILAAADLVLAMEQRQGVRLRDMGTAGGPVQVLMKLGEAARGVESLQAGRGAARESSSAAHEHARRQREPGGRAGECRCAVGWAQHSWPAAVRRRRRGGGGCPPIELVAVVGRVTSDGRFEQRLIVVDAHAVHLQQLRGDAGEALAKHKLADGGIDEPQVDDLRFSVQVEG